MKFLPSIVRHALVVAGLKIAIPVVIIALLSGILVRPGSAHETPSYADDAYPLGAIQATTQQICHGNHATIIQSLTAPGPGLYRLTQGGLSGSYKPRIVTAAWTGQVAGDVLTWSPTERDPRIVVLWEGEGCPFRMSVMELLPAITFLPRLQR